MPSVYQSGNFVDVDVYEFLSSCDKRDIDNVIDYLKDNGDIDERTLEEIDTPRSYTGKKFEEALLKLRGHSSSLSTEEEEYIINLANRIS